MKKKNLDTTPSLYKEHSHSWGSKTPKIWKKSQCFTDWITNDSRERQKKPSEQDSEVSKERLVQKKKIIIIKIKIRRNPKILFLLQPEFAVTKTRTPKRIPSNMRNQKKRLSLISLIRKLRLPQQKTKNWSYLTRQKKKRHQKGGPTAPPRKQDPTQPEREGKEFSSPHSPNRKNRTNFQAGPWHYPRLSTLSHWGKVQI